mmetsp:Transcript_66842/g.178691  ORF Transcript_66842/g.178691 Transcript_66842/m.178691 type:complete len:284 (+) Transcript_66842:100-951(+)
MKCILLLTLVFKVVISNADETPFKSPRISAYSRIASKKAMDSMLLLESSFAMPSSPYFNAYADMRPTSQPAFNLISPSGMANPILRSFSLLDQTSPPTQHALSTAAPPPHDPARTQSLSGGSSSSSHRTIHLGERYRRTSTIADSGAAQDPRQAVRDAAVERLTIKHATIQGIKDEGKDLSKGPTDVDSAEGDEDGDAGHHAKLDKKIAAYHGVLAKAVMVLAFLAVGAMCAGITGVIYCYRRDQNLVDPKDRALGEEARAKGKHFGRSTPQYGSYGAARGRR